MENGVLIATPNFMQETVKIWLAKMIKICDQKYNYITYTQLSVQYIYGK